MGKGGGGCRGDGLVVSFCVFMRRNEGAPAHDDEAALPPLSSDESRAGGGAEVHEWGLIVATISTYDAYS
jgi:hypothetical protein